ncbi:hypothetical protein [Amycolatopsis sp. cmx-11-12]|uniref:hypothetical protein n=1 Tax=Amycolatopsis sp. cmx-11-12 TaxID=2785795 RepID=UPI00391843E5
MRIPKRLFAQLALVVPIAAVVVAASVAPAQAATGPGNTLNLLFGSVDRAGKLLFSGTVSCAGTGSADLQVSATQWNSSGTVSIASGRQTVSVACPTTGHAITGALTPTPRAWAIGNPVRWHAVLANPSSPGQAPVATQEGFRSPQKGQATQNTVIAADSATLDDGAVTVSGTYECASVLARIGVAVAQGLVTGTSSKTATCPTSGPNRYKITISPLAVGSFRTGAINFSAGIGSFAVTRSFGSLTVTR